MSTVATARPNGSTIRSLLEGPAFRDAVSKALPTHLTPDRFIRVACTTLMRTPKLAQCEQSTFFNALLTLSQLGIEPDGRRAHLIPFENRKRNCTEVQLIIDYKGLVELALRSGTVSSIHADVVCDGDEFEYDRGELKRHKIDFRKPRGNAYAVYSLARFKDGTEPKCEVMTREDVESVRKRSRAGNNGPWVTDWNEMAKKTVFRRLSKWLTLSPEFRDAVDDDDDAPVFTSTAAERTLVEVVAPFDIPQQPEPEAQPEAADEAEQAAAGLAPEKKPEPASKPIPQDELESMIHELGIGIDGFKRWCAETGSLKDADSLGSWDDIPQADAERLLRALRGAKSRPVMLAQLETFKKATA